MKIIDPQPTPLPTIELSRAEIDQALKEYVERNNPDPSRGTITAYIATTDFRNRHDQSSERIGSVRLAVQFKQS